MIGEIRQNFTEASASVGLILATALLATSRPHVFLSERRELFRPRSGQASDEVAIGRPSSCAILNRTKDKT